MEGNKLFHDRYYFEKLLSKSSFSEAWLAKDMQTGNNVVVKKCDFKGNASQELVVSLHSSLISIIRQSHKNLVCPLLYSINDKEMIIVLPYYQKQLIHKKKLSEDEIWHFIYDIANGLDALHHMNPPINLNPCLFIHDILISEKGTFMIDEWYINNEIKNGLRILLNLPNCCGNTTYYAPERFCHNSQLDYSKCDIYSLGCIVYELLEGNPPFGESGGLAQIRGDDVGELQKNVSKRLRCVIYKCLSIIPDNRPSARDIATYAENELNDRKNNKFIRLWKQMIYSRKDIS